MRERLRVAISLRSLARAIAVAAPVCVAIVLLTQEVPYQATPLGATRWRIVDASGQAIPSLFAGVTPNDRFMAARVVAEERAFTERMAICTNASPPSWIERTLPFLQLASVKAQSACISTVCTGSYWSNKEDPCAGGHCTGFLLTAHPLTGFQQYGFYQTGKRDVRRKAP